MHLRKATAAMKRSFLVLVFAGVLRQDIVHCALPSGLSEDNPDVFLLMANFPSMVSIFDANNDGMLDCLAAYRTSFNQDAGSAEYIWMFPLPGNPAPQALKVHGQAEDGGKLLRKLDGDSTVYVGKFLYTDYQSCGIEELDFWGHHCILWSDMVTKDSLPQHCIDKFVELCGVDVPQNTRDLCVDGEGEN
ncbi:uncharacterized protein LOC144152630 [Haemaphysalis longicornis]